MNDVEVFGNRKTFDETLSRVRTDQNFVARRRKAKVIHPSQLQIDGLVKDFGGRSEESDHAVGGQTDYGFSVRVPRCFDPFALGILNQSFFLSGLEVMNGNGIVWGKAQDPHAIGGEFDMLRNPALFRPPFGAIFQGMTFQEAVQCRGNHAGSVAVDA